MTNSVHFAIDSITDDLARNVNKRYLCIRLVIQILSSIFLSKGSEYFLHHSDFTFIFREQALKKRLALVQDSMNTALSDNTSHRRDNGEQIARLTQAHR